MAKVALTNTEQKMLAVLSDGALHSRYELHDCLDDDLSTLAAVNVHIFRLRGKLPNGYDITCHRKGRETFFSYGRITSNRE